MTYQEALRYLETFVNYELFDTYQYQQRITLKRMRRFASLLGDPHKSIRSIHIAGSKGKGSTAAIDHSILTEAGFKVGLYTSPHLATLRERIRVNDELVSEAALTRLVETLVGVVDTLDEEEKPTFFELYTALAFLYFKEQKVDFGIFEAGLGGRLDATNLLRPLVCAITPISYEHTHLLGSTLEEIAAEKAGIIKNNSICILAAQEASVSGAIEAYAARKKATLFSVGKDISLRVIAANNQRQIVTVKGIFNNYSHCELPLLGKHQAENAATAVGIVEALRFHNITIPAAAVKRGIAKTNWDGRIEIVRREPFVIVDGAQNAASARALASSIRGLFSYHSLFLILGISKDKDVKGICDALAPISDHVFLTASRVRQRALAPSLIKNELQQTNTLTVTEDIETALQAALRRAKKDDLILITGSLYLVGEAKGVFSRAVSNCTA